MNALNTPLAELDPEVHAALRAELHRQQSTPEADFAEVADVIALALQPGPDVSALRARTATLAAAHPLHPHLSHDGDVR
ncbi:hypothetical protein ACWDGI_36725 [Streptomyces sp. NPDC001220]